jgi:hypothetical protein
MIRITTYPPKFPRSANGGYRYFFNGQEADNEVLGEGVSLTAEFWQYDSRLGIRWNVDPVFKEYESPYACFAGNPVWFVDDKGDTLRVTTKDGSFLFSLDDKKATTTDITAKKLYDKGIQWFEPLADNYMPLIKTAADLSTNPNLKHFTWQQVADFAEVNRPMASYRQGGAGDWKMSKDGADGYYLVTVGNYPYWSDAIGQIAYAVDFFTDNYLLTGEKGPSIRKTVQKGKEYGEGKLFGGKTDDSNTYDNYFILRGSLWASKRYSLEVTKRPLRSDKRKLKRTNYSPDKLQTPISKEEKNDYLR